MNRRILIILAALTFSLSGCGEDSYDEAKDNSDPLIPETHLAFDPANAVLPVPNDLLLSGSSDGTLNMPGESSGDYTNAQLALGALDGWSTTQPITIAFTPSRDGQGQEVGLLASSVAQPGAMRLFEATSGGPLSSDVECQSAPAVSACHVGEELTWGTDFITQASGNNVVLVPLKPLKPAQAYLYAATSLIKDTAGRSVAPSTTYALLKMDITTHPLETASQLQLQTLVNSYEKALASTYGVDSDNIIYAGLFTTQSVTDVYEAVKLLMLQSGSPYALSWLQTPTPAGYTVATAAGLTAADGSAYVLADLADVYTAAVKLPIYGDCSSTSCDSINGHWQALGDSPVAVLSALQAGTLSQANFVTQATNYGIDASAALANPALLVGKVWTLNDGTRVDKVRHLTRYNPIPVIKGYETIPLLITIPNTAKLTAFYSAQGKTFSAPTAGWPVTLALHGLGGGKEMALAYAGSYAAAGIAVVAMDMPLHGARSFDANADGVYEVSATDPSYGSVIGTPNAFVNGSPLVFVNIASTLSVRDNFRQATVDHLAMRLGISGLSSAQAAANTVPLFAADKVVAQGLSLGAIVATDLAHYASSGLIDPDSGNSLSNYYALKAVSLVAPSGGLAGSFAGSATFAPVLRVNILASDTFQSLVAAANSAGYAEDSAEYAALVQTVYEQFLPTFAFAVQTAIDSSDPINQAAQLQQTGLAVHLIEVVGDGSGNLADQVLPNRVSGFPLSGTEPLISALGLNCVDSAATEGAVRFSKGHHSSIVNPQEITGVTDGAAAAATAEMQSQVASFAASAVLDQPQIMVSNSAVVQPCGN